LLSVVTSLLPWTIIGEAAYADATFDRLVLNAQRIELTGWSANNFHLRHAKGELRPKRYGFRFGGNWALKYANRPPLSAKIRPKRRHKVRPVVRPHLGVTRIIPSESMY
jgi:hypothetical protein